jgi:hypothetical protein
MTVDLILDGNWRSSAAHRVRTCASLTSRRLEARPGFKSQSKIG